MKILHIRLERLAAFMFSGIDSLDATFTEALQIILGTNGSGKSHLLRQLTPLPPTSSEFIDKKGLKEITISHEGNIYRLISDFHNKDGAHSFYINDGENLNEGRTTDVQIALVEQHLGVTRKVDAILRVKHDFADMSQGSRKALLVETNPANLSFIIDDHQKVKRHIRGMIANLTMLNSRKAELESQLLDPSVLEEMRQVSLTLSEDTVANVGFISAIKTILATLPRSQSLVDYEGVSTLSTRADGLMKSVRQMTPYLDQIDTRDPAGRIAHLTGRVGELSAKEELNLSTLQETVQACEELQSSLDQMTDEVASTEVRLRIETLQTRLADVRKGSLVSGWSSSEIEPVAIGIDTLRGALERFLDCPVVIPTTKIYRMRQTRLTDLKYKSEALLSRVAQLNTRKAQIIKSQKIRLSDVPNEPCAKLACPLYAHFKDAYDTAKTEYETISAELKSLKRIIDRIERFRGLRQSQLDLVGPYMEGISNIHEILRMYPQLQSFFSGVDVPLTLRQNPMRFYHVAQEKLLGSRLRIEELSLEKQIAELDTELAKFSTLTEGEVVRITERLGAYKKRRVKLEQYLRTNQVEKQAVTTELYHLQSVVKVSEETSGVIALFEEQVGEAIRWKERRLLEELLEKLETSQREALTKQGVIAVQIREQDQLRARYEEEVVKQLDRLTAEKVEWDQLEKALADIPRRAMITYINSLIGIMNAYIASIFTYEFALVPLDIDNRLDYKFPINVAGVPVPDISECSKAQKEVIDLTFSLAVRKMRQLDDYPIYLDEVGASFDNSHKHRLLDLLTYVIEEHRVSQMFLVNHHAAVHEGLANNETMILNEANVVAPVVFNEHVVFNTER